MENELTKMLDTLLAFRKFTENAKLHRVAKMLTFTIGQIYLELNEQADTRPNPIELAPYIKENA